VGTFTLRGGNIAEINILADPERLAQLDVLAVWEGASSGEGPDAEG
jgi:hypothetical protein